MLAILILSTFVAAGVYGQLDDCNLPKSCYENEHSFKFPETKVDLEQTCKYLLHYYECVILARETCESVKSEQEDMRVAHNMVAALKDLCNEDSLVYAVIVDNLQCLKSLADDYGKCVFDSPDEELLQEHVEVLRDEGIPVFSENNTNAQMCLQGMELLACEVLRIERKCGAVVMDAVIEIIRKTSFMFIDGCSEEIKEYIRAVVRVVKQVTTGAEVRGKHF